MYAHTYKYICSTALHEIRRITAHSTRDNDMVVPEINVQLRVGQLVTIYNTERNFERPILLQRVDKISITKKILPIIVDHVASNKPDIVV